MSNICVVNILIIITICFYLAFLLIFYFSIKSDIRILTNANKLDDLNKWALKYVKKYKFNKNIILDNLSKQIESGKKNIKIQKWCLLIVTLFFIAHFTSRDPYTVHILWETVHIGREQLTILNGLMILCLLVCLFPILLTKLIHKRNIVANEQLSRIFKEEKNSQNNVTQQ